MSVKIRRLPGQVTVRDTKDPRGPELRFSVADWAEFIDHVRQNPSPGNSGRLCLPDGRIDLAPLPRRRRLPRGFIDPDITGMGRPPLAPELAGRR